MSSARSQIPRYFIDDLDAVSGDRLIIRGAVARRLNRVMRLRRGDAIEVVHPPAERLYRLRIASVAPETIECEIEHSRPLEPPPAPRITLCPALIRPQRFDFMLEKVTELGVAAIQPIRTERAIARSESPERLARWQRLATEASEQSRRETRPEIHPPQEFAALAAAPPAPNTLRILASAVETETRIVELVRAAPPPAEVQILVGPEGGFSPSEEDLAQTNGWRAATLGPRPLRAETASIVAVALLEEAIAAQR